MTAEGGCMTEVPESSGKNEQYREYLNSDKNEQYREYRKTSFAKIPRHGRFKIIPPPVGEGKKPIKFPVDTSGSKCDVKSFHETAEEVIKTLKKDELLGLSFVGGIIEGEGENAQVVVALDYDHVIPPFSNGYCERSVSGAGAHTIIRIPYTAQTRATLEAARKGKVEIDYICGECKGQLEMFYRVQGVVLTGDGKLYGTEASTEGTRQATDISAILRHLATEAATKSKKQAGKKSGVSVTGTHESGDWHPRILTVKLWEKWKRCHTAVDICLRNGYIWADNDPERLLYPRSTTGSPGVQIQDSGERVFSHHSDDPLGRDGYPHDAWDCFVILECNNDPVEAALRVLQELGEPKIDPRAVKFLRGYDDKNKGFDTYQFENWKDKSKVISAWVRKLFLDGVEDAEEAAGILFTIPHVREYYSKPQAWEKVVRNIKDEWTKSKPVWLKKRQKAVEDSFTDTEFCSHLKRDINSFDTVFVREDDGERKGLWSICTASSLAFQRLCFKQFGLEKKQQFEDAYARVRIDPDLPIGTIDPLAGNNVIRCIDGYIDKEGVPCDEPDEYLTWRLNLTVEEAQQDRDISIQKAKTRLIRSLRECYGEETLDYLLHFIAAGLFGRPTRDRRVVDLIGRQRSAKTTLGDALIRLGLASDDDITTFIGGERFSYSATQTLPIYPVIVVNDTKKIDTTIIKRYIGQNRIEVDVKNENPIQVHTRAQIIMTHNTFKWPTDMGGKEKIVYLHTRKSYNGKEEGKFWQTCEKDGSFVELWHLIFNAYVPDWSPVQDMSEGIRKHTEVVNQHVNLYEYALDIFVPTDESDDHEVSVMTINEIYQAHLDASNMTEGDDKEPNKTKKRLAGDLKARGIKWGKVRFPSSKVVVEGFWCRVEKPAEEVIDIKPNPHGVSKEAITKNQYITQLIKAPQDISPIPTGTDNKIKSVTTGERTGNVESCGSIMTTHPTSTEDQEMQTDVGDTLSAHFMQSSKYTSKPTKKHNVTLDMLKAIKEKTPNDREDRIASIKLIREGHISPEDALTEIENFKVEIS